MRAFPDPRCGIVTNLAQETNENVSVLFVSYNKRWEGIKMEVLEQFLVQAELHIQMILAAGVFLLILIEGIHVLQLRKINKRLNLAGRKLENYLATVFEDDDLADTEEVAQGQAGDEAQPIHVQGNGGRGIHSRQRDSDMSLYSLKEDGSTLIYSRKDEGNMSKYSREEGDMSLYSRKDEVDMPKYSQKENGGKLIYSRQEHEMRNAIAEHKKQKNDTQLLDTVLEEIFS